MRLRSLLQPLLLGGSEGGLGVLSRPPSDGHSLRCAHPQLAQDSLLLPRQGLEAAGTAVKLNQDFKRRSRGLCPAS